MSIGLSDLTTTIKGLLDSEEPVEVVWADGDELRHVVGAFRRVNDWQVMFEATGGPGEEFDLKTDTIEAIYEAETGDLL